MSQVTTSGCRDIGIRKLIFVIITPLIYKGPIIDTAWSALLNDITFQLSFGLNM